MDMLQLEESEYNLIKFPSAASACTSAAMNDICWRFTPRPTRRNSSERQVVADGCFPLPQWPRRRHAAYQRKRPGKVLGWILVAIFSPVILLIALLCSLGSGGAEHNNYSVEACFYGAEFSRRSSGGVPISHRGDALGLSLLDSAVSLCQRADGSGNSLDPIRVKAVFCPLLWDDAPSKRAANSFVGASTPPKPGHEP